MDLLKNLGESRRLRQIQFLGRLGRLSSKQAHDDVRPPSDEENLEVSHLEELRQQGRDTEAFFLARRMAAQGVEGQKNW